MNGGDNDAPRNRLTEAEHWAIRQLRCVGHADIAEQFEREGTIASIMATITPSGQSVAWAILQAALIEHCASSCRTAARGLHLPIPDAPGLNLPHPRRNDG